MRMLLLLPVLVIATSSTLSAQKIELKNVLVADEKSKTIYLDVENKFALSDFIKGIDKSPNTISYVLHEDTLTIIPTRAGAVEIVLETDHGKQPVLFTAKTLPVMSISLAGQTSNVVSKTALLNNPKIDIQQTDAFFTNYRVDSAAVTINGQSFRLAGSKISGGLLEAINKAGAGDKLVFTQVCAVNTVNGKTAGLHSMVSFQLQ